MANNTNKQRIIELIWENPERVFDCKFRLSGVYLENIKGGTYAVSGAIRLARNTNGTNIRVFGNTGSGVAGISDGNGREGVDVFTYLQDYVLHTAGFGETLQRCAERYGVTLEYSEQERKRMNREALSREVAASLVEALRLNPDGAAAQYIKNVRGLEPDKHFGELSADSVKRAKESLRQRNISFTDYDFDALFIKEDTIREKQYTVDTLIKWGYDVVIPYTRNGIAKGFVLRNTRKGSTMPKYWCSEGLGRGGYCDTLTIGKPVIFVEGYMDAIRLMQSGAENVVAMGGAQISEDIAALFKSRNITQVTYIPDIEYDANKQQETKIIRDVIKSVNTVRVDDEQVITNMYVAELPKPNDFFTNPVYKKGNDQFKIDVDTYGQINGGNSLLGVIALDAVTSWRWELTDLMNRATAKEQTDGTVNISWFQTEFDKIYGRIENPYERQRVKDAIKDDAVFKAFGVTPEALNDKDEWNRNKEYNNRVKLLSSELVEAVEKGANPVKVGEISARLATVQGTNTRDEWEKQFNQTFDDELAAIAQQPDTIKTRWEVGNITPTGYIKYENVEYYPADVSVICAISSHGKTMFLMQSAIDTVKKTNKTVLYVSCEENKRQLLQRALNVYMDIPTTEDGKDTDGKECVFIRGTRKRAIKAVLRNADTCTGYDDYMGVSTHFRALKQNVNKWVERYGNEIRPRLKFIHTNGTAESIAANVLHYVEQFRNEGNEVAAVFVDYMQLLTSDNKSFSRTDELKDVCTALKTCAEKLEIPVIVAAQLNRAGIMEGIDSITMANLAEGADIERIAHDIYFVWQIDKTKRDKYFSWKFPRDKEGKEMKNMPKQEVWNFEKSGDRSNRIFTKPNAMRTYTGDGTNTRELKRGYMYVEQIKARDGRTEGWALLPFDGERGYIGEIDTEMMAI